MASVIVPDSFRQELSDNDASAVNDLRYDCHLLLGTGTPEANVVDKMVGVGWSREFASWYVAQIRAEGLDLRLIVPKYSSKEVESAQSQIDSDMATVYSRRAAVLAAAGLFLLVLAVILPAKPDLLAYASALSISAAIGCSRVAATRNALAKKARRRP